MTDAPQPPQTETIDHVLDREAALAFVGHDAGFLGELLEAFGDYRLGIVERIETAVRAENATELREVAHQLKGALGNFHARAAVTTARQLEEAGRQETLHEAAALCESLNRELDELCDAIGTLLQELQATAIAGRDSSRQPSGAIQQNVE